MLRQPFTKETVSTKLKEIQPLLNVTSVIGYAGSISTPDEVISKLSVISVLTATSSLPRYETPSPKPAFNDACSSMRQ